MTTHSITHESMHETMSKLAKVMLTCAQCKHSKQSSDDTECNTCDVLGGPDDNFKSRDGMVQLRG